MPKKRKKTKKDNSSITRRDLLKGAGAAGAAAVLSPIMLTSRKAFASQDTTITAPPAEPVSCDFGVVSPPTRPFVDALPVPATAPRTPLSTNSNSQRFTCSIVQPDRLAATRRGARSLTPTASHYRRRASNLH